MNPLKALAAARVRGVGDQRLRTVVGSWARECPDEAVAMTRALLDGLRKAQVDQALISMADRALEALQGPQEQREEPE